MASLLDKLRNAKPVGAGRKSASMDCMTVLKRFRLEGYTSSVLAVETIRLLQGIDIESDIVPSDILFFDTETTGLSGGAGTLAFLVGAGGFEGGEFVVHQFLMRDYDEEIFVLQRFKELLDKSRLIVSFNGASFDIPLLQSRFVMHRMHHDVHFPPHVDLLHAARRIYKLRIGKCTLSHLEEVIFSEKREGDLPGAKVPERYFRYMKTGDESMLEEILEHNSKDIHSLARLLYTLAQLHETPQLARHQEDIFSLGKVYELRKRKDRARICYRALDGGILKMHATHRLADMSRKSGNAEEAAELYEQLLHSGKAVAQTYISLAKIYEHRLRQYDKALAMAHRGMLYCLERLSVEAVQKSRDYRDLEHRHARLMTKVRGTVNGNNDAVQGSFRAGEAPKGGQGGGF